MFCLFLLSAVATAAMASGDEVAPSSDPHFPTIKAANLEKQSVVLPRDFAGDRNLVLIAFQREQQAEVDSWLKEMKRFEQLDPKFRYYELPTIQSSNALTRWFIDTGMRRGIPDKSARTRTITLYLDKKPFLRALNLESEKTIYALLVDRSGRVLWRGEGAFDEQKGAKLKQALENLAGASI